MKRKLVEDIDYVEFFSEKLRDDSSLFKQHKKFIDSQFRMSQSLFSNAFGKDMRFKINARRYLLKRGLIIKNDRI